MSNVRQSGLPQSEHYASCTIHKMSVPAWQLPAHVQTMILCKDISQSEQLLALQKAGGQQVVPPILDMSRLAEVAGSQLAGQWQQEELACCAASRSSSSQQGCEMAAHWRQCDLSSCKGATCLQLPLSFCTQAHFWSCSLSKRNISPSKPPAITLPSSRKPRTCKSEQE